MRGILLAGASLPFLLAACVPPDAGSVRSDTTPSVAFEPGYRLDHERGVWGTQSIVPPPGLVTVRQGDLVGRTVQDGAGQDILWIEYALADPVTGDARYAIASSGRFSGYVALPLSAMRITAGTVQVDASARSVSLLPRYTLAELERRYPRTVLNTLPPLAPLPPARVTGTVLPPAPVAVVPPAAPAPPVAEPLQLVRRGSVVGYPVVDTYGQSLGVVDAVAARPVTGEVRYAIVSSPMLGFGTYIAVPAAGVQSASGRVIVPGTSASWMQAPRYRGDQVQQLFGSLGTTN